MRIVLVDDEPNFANALRRALCRIEPEWEIDQIVHVDDTTPTAILTGRYDLVVLDWNLGEPNVTGLDLCRDLRRRGCRTPIVLLTVRDEPDDRIHALTAGADDHIVKNLGLREIHARMKVAASRPAAPTIIEVGPLRADLERQQIFVSSKPVEVSKHPWRLLVRLMRTPGEPVRAEELCAFAGIEPGPLNKNLANEVHRLRGRLEEAERGAGDWVHAVRGVGYVVADPRQK